MEFRVSPCGVARRRFRHQLDAVRWPAGCDLVGRAERVDADNRLHDWTLHVAPGVDYIPFPNSAHPFSVGVVAPFAPHPRGRDYAAFFPVMRWNESVTKRTHLPRRGEARRAEE